MMAVSKHRSPARERRGVDSLMIQLGMLLATEGRQPLYDAAVDAIRDYQRTHECNGKPDNLAICELFDPRIANRLESDLRVLMIDELERIPVERIVRLPNFGIAIVNEIAAVLREHFRPRVNGGEVVEKWYWLPDGEIASRYMPTQKPARKIQTNGRRRSGR